MKITKEEIAMGYVDQDSADSPEVENDFKLFIDLLDKHRIPNEGVVIHCGFKMYRDLKKRSDSIRMIRRMKSLKK